MSGRWDGTGTTEQPGNTAEQIAELLRDTAQLARSCATRTSVVRTQVEMLVSTSAEPTPVEVTEQLGKLGAELLEMQEAARRIQYAADDFSRLKDIYSARLLEMDVADILRPSSGGT